MVGPGGRHSVFTPKQLKLDKKTGNSTVLSEVHASDALESRCTNVNAGWRARRRRALDGKKLGRRNCPDVEARRDLLELRGWRQRPELAASGWQRINLRKGCEDPSAHRYACGQFFSRRCAVTEESSILRDSGTE